MIQNLFGVDLIEFGKQLGLIALFNLIWIGIWYLTFRFTARFIKGHIEDIKDKEIGRIVEERNKYQEIFLEEHMLSSKAKKIMKKKIKEKKE